MLAPLALVANLASEVYMSLASPAQRPLSTAAGHRRFFDVQAHRGGRGNTVENTLPSFAWCVVCGPRARSGAVLNAVGRGGRGLIDGATTLELDNGITKDGHVVVWHDEEITAAKCVDTHPAHPNDPAFPYVGKYIANLTLAQLRTIDCGSKRQHGYPMQLTYPGTRISTLDEVFDFVECADPQHEVLWNIESKIDARHPNRTLGVADFVGRQHAAFRRSPYRDSITYQSFDWRTLVAMKKLDSTVVTSALIDDETGLMPDNSTTPWLAGLRLDAFPGPTLSQQVAQAASHIGVDVLSPGAESFATPVLDPAMDGFVPFATREMVEEAHRLGLLVKPWTVNRMNIVEQLLDWKVDGIISDYPNVVRRLVKQQGLPTAPKFPKQRVLGCLEEHMRKQQGW